MPHPSPVPSTPSAAALPARLAGVFTALATPFRGDRVDGASLERLVKRQVAAGVAGLCPCGTTGESPTLSGDEQREVIAAVVAAAGGRVPVIPGASTNDTRRSVERVRAAREAGAVAALAVSPYYNRPTQEGLYRHYRAMIDEGGLPLLLYHIPSRTGVHVEVETIARLHAAGGIVGLKEAHGSVERVTRIREACDVPILSGDDALTLPMIALGAVGIVSVASNVIPDEIVRMVREALAGRVEDALAHHEEMAPLVRALFLETNPIPLKAALHLRGWIDSEAVRLPLVPATKPVVEALRVALQKLVPASAGQVPAPRA